MFTGQGNSENPSRADSLSRYVNATIVGRQIAFLMLAVVFIALRFLSTMFAPHITSSR